MRRSTPAHRGCCFSVQRQRVLTFSQSEVEQWLELKRQELLLKRQLRRLAHVPEQLLRIRDFDGAALAMGLELTRPDNTIYHYARDPFIPAAQQEQERLISQLAQRQQQFRQDCISGRRQLDLDFTPQRRLVVQLRLPVLPGYSEQTDCCSPCSRDAAAGAGVDVPSV